MRRTHWVAGALGFMSVASGAYTTGCFFNSADDCTKTLMCGASSEAGTTTTSTSTGTGTAPGCIPSENSGPVGDGCGVFVALDGDDGDDGSKSSPVKTLKKAIELAKGNGNTVYACAGSFNEAVELPGSVSLFGGLDCKGDWGYGGETKRTVIAPVVAANPPPMADVIPLKVLGKGDTRIENVDVRAPDAVLPGGSSIAVIVENTTAAITNCTFTAGAGAAGANGMTPTEAVGPSDPNDMTIRGENGQKACLGDATGTLGGVGTANPSCMTSIGGKGGAGGIAIANGSNGEDGVPAGEFAKGKGGAGDTGGGCDTGGSGQLGSPGMSGVGATEAGSISSSGYTGVSGTPGMPGSAGQGGGGGGGAKGKAGCNGASGGGGGAGGCGGAGGLGGQAGGGSIALISLNATLTFSGVNIKVGAGGKGGDGGDGQDGGVGGTGGFGGSGMSTAPACNGGPGGAGGLGGKGGGGRGGPSIGIASKGKAPAAEGVSITIGEAGAGGVGAGDTGKGTDGQEAQTFQFKD